MLSPPRPLTFANAPGRRDRIMNVAPTALGGLARSYRASVHGGVLSAVRARVCAVRAHVSSAVSHLGMSPERGP